MGDIKFELNSAGVKQLLQGAEMQSVLSGYADGIAGRASGTPEVYVAQTRAVAEVKGNNKDNALLKALR